MTRRTSKIDPPKTDHQSYRQLWRIVDGAVRSCFKSHPDYVPSKQHERTIRNSINKRVVGAVLGYTTEVVRVRSSASEADEKTVSRLDETVRDAPTIPRAGRLSGSLSLLISWWRRWAMEVAAE